MVDAVMVWNEAVVDAPQHGLNAAGHVYLVVDVADFPWGFQITVAGAVAAGRLAVTVACGDAV